MSAMTALCVISAVRRAELAVHAARSPRARARPCGCRARRSARRTGALGLLGDRARDRDALLLAARELRRESGRSALAEPDERERLGRGTIGSLRDLGDERDVLARGQARDQVVELEHEADVLAADSA